MACIGIDLGTTHSLLAIYEEGQARLIKNNIDELLTPSVVSVSSEGQLLIGAPARERLITNPSNSAHAFKRMMGTDKVFKLGKEKFRAEELSSLILKKLKEDAEAELGEAIVDAVISVPAYFNDVQRNSTKVAAELAGLNVLRLINEPTAASLVYGLQDKENEKHFLVLDLGGGTFDVTILELFEGVFEVHASAGDNHLGGEDFTDLIVKWLAEQPEVINCKLVSPQLYVLAEGAKRSLSETDNVIIDLPNGEAVKLTQAVFEKIATPLLTRVRQPILKAINDANLTPSDFDEIVLVGGSTRMPLIRQFVTRLFGRFPQSRENPDHVVALGAAIQAGLLQRGEGLDEIVLTDVMPYSLGISVFNESMPDKDYFHPIIERNQTIPLSRVENFSTVNENQNVVEVKVYQGESRYAENNLLLDSFEIQFPKRKRHETFDVRFTYDNNGILEINAQSNTESDIQQSLVIQQRSGQMSDEEVREALKKIEHLKIHPRDDDKNKTLLERAERLYQQNIGEKREQIAQLIQYFDQMLASQDPHEIARACQEFEESLKAFEGKEWF